MPTDYDAKVDEIVAKRADGWRCCALELPAIGLRVEVKANCRQHICELQAAGEDDDDDWEWWDGNVAWMLHEHSQWWRPLQPVPEAEKADEHRPAMESDDDFTDAELNWLLKEATGSSGRWVRRLVKELKAHNYLRDHSPSNAQLREWASRCEPPIESLDPQEEKPWDDAPPPESAGIPERAFPDRPYVPVPATPERMSEERLAELESAADGLFAPYGLELCREVRRCWSDIERQRKAIQGLEAVHAAEKVALAARDRRIAELERELDPPVCRLQFPNGSVPANVREAAEGWKQRHDELNRLLSESADKRIAQADLLMNTADKLRELTRERDGLRAAHGKATLRIDELIRERDGLRGEVCTLSKVLEARNSILANVTLAMRGFPPLVNFTLSEHAPAAPPPAPAQPEPLTGGVP